LKRIPFKNELIIALEQRGIKNPEQIIDRMKSFGAVIDESINKDDIILKKYIKNQKKISQTAEFISNYMAFSNDINHYPLLFAKRKENEIVWRLELYSCFPKNIIGPLFDGVYSAVLVARKLYFCLIYWVLLRKEWTIKIIDVEQLSLWESVILILQIIKRKPLSQHTRMLSVMVGNMLSPSRQSGRFGRQWVV
jgi:hypothetical protein